MYVCYVINSFYVVCLKRNIWVVRDNRHGLQFLKNNLYLPAFVFPNKNTDAEAKVIS